MSKLTIIRGLPGSGKSTLAKALAVANGSLHLETDQWFVNEKTGEYKFVPANVPGHHASCLKATIKALDAGTDVIVSNTFTQKWEIQRYLDAMKEWHHDLEIFECSNRFENTHDVPTHNILKMRDRWEIIHTDGYQIW